MKNIAIKQNRAKDRKALGPKTEQEEINKTKIKRN